jgi:hypothetical protein
MSMRKRIINVDKMKVIGFFYESERDAKIQELKEAGWKDVSVDHEGDITVWEDE